MSRGVNKVILVGNLGKDPEVISFEGGVKKASFSLATTEVFRNRDGQDVEQTEWHNIVMWRGLADIAEKYLRKGSQIYVEGRIKTRSYEKDGQKRYVTDIECTEMNMLGSRASEDHGGNPSRQSDTGVQNAAPAPTVPEKEDDLPF